MKFKFIFASILLSSLLITSCNGGSKQKEAASETATSETTKTEIKKTTIHLTKAEFLAKVVNFEANPNEWKYLGDKPALIDFYADWCGPCKVIAPILEELAGEYGDEIYIYKIDTDKEVELASAFQIQSIPSLLFIPMTGQPVMERGAHPKDVLKDKINTILLGK